MRSSCRPPPATPAPPIGAALAAYRDATGVLPGGPVRSCYLGPAYPDFTPAPAPAPGLSARQVADPARFLAAQLAAGKIAGLFQGRLEAGPRALGNRSILASPLIPDVAGRLNAAVKFREPFRPFAPVVLAEKAADYFQLAQPSPYMSIAVPVTDLAREKVPAVVHANGTARVQTLAPGENPFLADVLDCFAELTGVPVLINTSLNVKGKPISGTPQMAIDCLASSGLDGLMLDGGWWVSQVRIGYSFWGFLGPGITDTPDGGRSHRRTLIDGLTAAGHDIVFLQRNRDLDEAGHDLRHRYAWDDGLPAHRRAVPGVALAGPRPQHHRRAAAPATPATCTARTSSSPTTPPGAGSDHRVGQGPATAAPARRCGPMPNVTVCEAALAAQPRGGQPAVPRRRQRPGQRRPGRPWRRCPGRCRWSTSGTSTTATRRSPSSSRPPPRQHPHRVAGKWTRTAAWPHVNFTGRCAFPDVRELYESALATVLLLPDRYARRGTDDPAAVRGRARRMPARHPRQRSRSRAAFTPPALHAATGDEVAGSISGLQRIAGTSAARRPHRRLHRDCSASSACPASSPPSTGSSGGSPMPVPRVRRRVPPPAARVGDRGPDRDHRLRGQRQVPPGPRARRQAGHHARAPRRPVLRPGLEAAGPGGVRRPAARPGRRAPVDHRRELRLHPADPAPGRRHRDLPRPARLGLPAGHPPAPG